MPGTLQVRSYRQRKAGACGGYSHRDLYGGPTTGLPLQRSLVVLRFIFPGLAVAVFCTSAASPRKERPQ